MNAQDLVDKVVPPKYHVWAVALLAVSPYVTRAYHAIANGGGIRGIFSAIWLGTNLPKDVKEDVQNTKQAVVSGNTDILTKPVEGK